MITVIFLGPSTLMAKVKFKAMLRHTFLMEVNAKAL